MQQRRVALAAPKKEKNLRVVKENKQNLMKQKILRPSEVRLKVRNLDEKQVTNDDLKKLFQKIGELKVCRFDRNEFGQFLGSATVTFERPEDAKRAVHEYNGAYLDDKVLTVEFDMIPGVTHVVKAATGPNSNPERVIRTDRGPVLGKSNQRGKTLRLNKN